MFRIEKTLKGESGNIVFMYRYKPIHFYQIHKTACWNCTLVNLVTVKRKNLRTEVKTLLLIVALLSVRHAQTGINYPFTTLSRSTT